MEKIVIKLDNKFKNIRIDKVLFYLLPKYSRNYIQKLIKNGNIVINNKLLKKSIKVKGYEKICIYTKIQKYKIQFLFEKMFISYIYEDKNILVINKSVNVVVHPALGNWSNTLLNGLIYNNPKLTNIPRAGIIHRLDKNTTGIIIVGKTLNSYFNLVKQLKNHLIKRYYLVLVWGIINTQGVINKPILRNPKNRKKMIILKNKNSKKSITYYRRIAIGKINHSNVSLVYCQLKTGRTHQIRVHMKFIGYSIVGDKIYGNNNNLSILKYQALISKKIVFIHPKNKKILTLSIDISLYFLRLLKYSKINYYKLNIDFL